MRRLARTAATLALAALLLAPAAARAGDPVMALGDVRSGMRCTGLSVVRGTEISSFDVEVLDVVAGSLEDLEPRILVRVSGPAVDQGGIAEGFSGSPVYCPDAQGASRVIGALSYGIGQYGDTVGLATPIEQMLAEQPPPAAGTRTVTRAAGGAPARDGALARPGAADRPGLRVSIRPRLLRRARPLASPLSIGGVSPALARTLTAAGRRAGRSVRAAPAGPLAGLRPQALRPGASVVAGFASGDLSAGGLGTVTYTDGDRIWAFGHSFEGIGARRLLLQDAYVYGVVYNPVNAGDAVSYKLGAAGNILGTLTYDALDAVVGRVGAAPPLTDLRVLARDTATGRRVGLQSRVSDEGEIGNPLGSTMSLLVPLALIQADSLALRATPPEQSLSLCMRMTLAGRSKPLRFCNRYVGDADDQALAVDDGTGGSAAVLRMLVDATLAVGLVDSYAGPPLRLTRLGMDLRTRSGLTLANMRGADAPRRVRPGRPFRVGLRLRTPQRRTSSEVVAVTLPRATRPGLYELHLAGTRSDAIDEDLEDVLAGEMTPGDGDETKPPRTVRELAARVSALSRFDGVTVRLGRPGSKGGRVVARFRDPSRRLSGRASVRIRVAG